MKHSVIRVIDALSETLGTLAAWLFFITGLMISYEVVARYLFNAPTIWAAELSQMLLLWATYLGISRLLRRDQHIRINALETLLPASAKRWLHVFSLLFISLLCLLVVYYGALIFWDSFERGRSTGTMLNIPNWWTEIVIPLGFSLLFLQTLVQLYRQFDQSSEHDSAT